MPLFAQIVSVGSETDLDTGEETFRLTLALEDGSSIPAIVTQKGASRIVSLSRRETQQDIPADSHTEIAPVVVPRNPVEDLLGEQTEDPDDGFTDEGGVSSL